MKITEIKRVQIVSELNNNGEEYTLITDYKRVNEKEFILKFKSSLETDCPYCGLSNKDENHIKNCTPTYVQNNELVDIINEILDDKSEGEYILINGVKI